MRFSIEGFSQQKAVELGLSAEDLVILRWFVDFWPSGMIKMVSDGKEYGLVNYGRFSEQMPIIGCNKRTIARKFQRLVESGVLENTTIRQNGSFSVYRFGRNYLHLVDKSTTPDKNVQTVDEKCTDPLYKNVQPPLYKNVQPNSNTFKSNNLLDSSSFNSNDVADAPSWMDDPSLSERMVSAISDWLEYKKERREPYKPTGLKSLITQIKNQVGQYGEAPVIEVMISSMGSGYKGICFDKLKSSRGKQQESFNPFMDLLREEGEI